MHIIAQCPRCHYRWWLNAAAADRRLRCRKCFRLLRVPDLTEVSEAADIVSEAKSRVFVDDAGKTYG